MSVRRQHWLLGQTLDCICRQTFDDISCGGICCQTVDGIYCGGKVSCAKICTFHIIDFVFCDVLESHVVLVVGSAGEMK